MIIVVGTPCSGTSLTAGVMHHLGVKMGDIASREEVMDHQRPYMHFECIRLQALIKGLGEIPPVEMIRDTLRRYIERRQAGTNGVIGVKNFTILYIAMKPELLEDLDIQTVYARRDIADVLRSDIKWRGWDLDRAQKMGAAHMAMFKMLTEKPPIAIMDYEKAMSDPVGTTKTFAEQIGVPWRPEAAEFIDPEKKGIVT